MNDDRSSLDGTNTSRLKRKIPAVTDVLDELARALKTDPYGKAKLFDAAQRVCAEELRRLKAEGGQPANLGILAERARDLLNPVRRTHAESAPVPAAAPPAANPPAAEAAYLEDEPFDLSSPPAANSIAIPRLGDPASEDESSIVFAPEPAVRMAAAPAPMPPPRPTRERKVPVPAAETAARPSAPRTPPVSTPRKHGSTVPYRITPHPRKHPALRVFLWMIAAAAVAGGGYSYFNFGRWLPPRVSGPGQSRPGTLASADWDGKPPVYMLHFSSSRSRGDANREAERLAKKTGRTAHVLAVDPGAEGRGYRVLVGDFATAEEALAFRAGLAAQKTPELGPVFRVTGPNR